MCHVHPCFPIFLILIGYPILAVVTFIASIFVSIAQDAGLNMFFVTIAGGVGFIVGSMIITLIIILIEKLKAK